MIYCHANGERLRAYRPEDLLNKLEDKAKEFIGTIEYYLYDQTMEYIRRKDYDSQGTDTLILDARGGRKAHGGQRERTNSGRHRNGSGPHRKRREHKNQKAPYSEGPQEAE